MSGPTEPTADAAPDRDPLIDKLIETFGPARDSADVAPFGTPAYAQIMMTSVPIEQVADSVNAAYLSRTRTTINRLSTGTDWNPAHWCVVCPPYLFHGHKKVNGVEIRRTGCLDWQVFLVNTEALAFADPVPMSPPPDPVRYSSPAHRLMLELTHPYIDAPLPDPTSFLRITGV